MSTVVGSITKFSGGIADSEKEGQPDSYAFGKSINFRSDPRKLTILPKTIKETGSLIEAMPKWGEREGSDVYVADEDGNIYKRDSSDDWTKEHKAVTSHGNGLGYFGEDQYLYYTQDKSIGRYGRVGGTDPAWYDNFLESEGGEPTNTHSIILEKDSSQYLDRADTADASITSDLTIEVGFKPESLPGTSETMTLVGKWNDQGVSSGNLLETGTSDRIYQHTGFSILVTDSFSSPNNAPRGISSDEDENVLSADTNSAKMYKHSGFSSTITDSFAAPDIDPLGIAWDADNLLGAVAAKMYKHSGFSSTISSSFSTVDASSVGCAWDGTNVLGTGVSSKIFRYSGFSSTVSDSFARTTASYIAWDGGNVLYSDGSANKIFELSGFSSTITDSFASAATIPQGIAFDGFKGIPQGKSYLFEIAAITNFFGDGSDGALTISTDTTQAPTDSACTGTINTNALTATNAAFAAGDQILIVQAQGTGGSVKQFNEIQSYTAGTITTVLPLNHTYATGAQVIVIPQYSSVTINSGKTWTAKAWNGTVGGILVFKCSGTFTYAGTLSAIGKGFRGGDRGTTYGSETQRGQQGESYLDTGSQSQDPNEGGGGGGSYNSNKDGAGGGGGSYGEEGMDGTGYYGYPSGSGCGFRGYVYGFSDLSYLFFGSGGGGGGIGGSVASTPHADAGKGGAGGGALVVCAKTVTRSGTGYLSAYGGGGHGPWQGKQAGGGGGSGGSILIKCQTATLGASVNVGRGAAGLIEEYGDDGGGRVGGAGGAGRAHIDYYTSYTGGCVAAHDLVTHPPIHDSEDQTLTDSDGFALRLRVSDDGDASEILKWDITDDIPLDEWARWSVAWDASVSTAYFYLNGALLGSDVGSMTAIHDNACTLSVGANYGSTGTMANFIDGNLDDIRIFNDLRTATEIAVWNAQVISSSTPNLKIYYKFDDDATDDGTGNNDLTAHASPVYDINDVLFAGITTRQDLDQSLDTSGDTYTLLTAINEGSAHRQTFTPAKDPQKSLEVMIAAKGTGNWTLTVHDSLNRTIVTKTVATGELYTGDYEFIFDTAWRPVIGADYHFHLTSTVADGTVVTTSSENLETADFHTYFQILVEDTAFHPIAQHLNLQCFGNERYLATYDGQTYTPHALTLPSGYKVRCLGHWREYLAIGTWKGSSITTDDEGRDGISDTYNFHIDVPEGGINALHGSRGLLYVWAGYSGDFLIYMGGEAAQKVKQLPKMTMDKYVEIYPGAVDMWRGLMHFGVAGASDSTVLERGVYSYGSLTRNYPDALGFDYPLSIEDTTGTSIEIGMVKAAGQDLLIGFKNGPTYGVDVIKVDADPYIKATFEALISDLGGVSQTSYPLTLRADFEELVSGESIILKYKADREDYWQKSDAEEDVDATDLRMIIQEQVKEIQVAVELKTTTTTGPALTGVTLETELAQEEIPA